MPTNSGVVTVSSSPTLVCAARHGRTSLTVQNHGSTTVYLGGSTVGVGSGIRLLGVDGAALCLNDVQSAMYGIADGTDAEMSFIEVWPK
jgi:hypothetical protein